MVSAAAQAGAPSGTGRYFTGKVINEGVNGTGQIERPSRRETGTQR